MVALASRSTRLFSLAILALPALLAACSDDITEGTTDEVGDTDSETAASETVGDESGESGMEEIGETTDESSDDTTTEEDTTTEDDTTTDGTETETGGEELDCLDAQFASGMFAGTQYGGYDFVIGSHCLGTNNQDITDIERVVFLGDSVTVGTPPATPDQYYRSILADELAMKFGLDAPNFLWKTPDPINGVALVEEDGDFASCSEWGARTDDLLMGGQQIANCFEGDDFQKRTLVIMTMGGNDLAALAKDGLEGATEEALWEDVELFVQYQREAMHWFVDDPNKFPNGVFVVYANPYEYTDGTGDLLSCPASIAAGFTANWDDPELLKSMVLEASKGFAEVAEETQVDLAFLGELFCGRGFKSDDPSTPCYRGPGEPTWFDLTCIHPTADGHQAIADMFMAVINE